MEGLIEAPIGVNDEEQRYEFGTLYYWNGRLFRYAKFVDSVDYSDGHVVEWAAANFSAVTNDKSGGSSLGRLPAGVALNAVTSGNFGFFQVGGLGVVRLYAYDVDGTAQVAAGDFLVSDSATDGMADQMADGEEEQVFAVATAAGSSSYVAAGNYVIRGLA